MATEPRVSTGTIATTSNPTTPTGTVTITAAPAEFNDVGTNSPTVTLQQSQATPSSSGAVPYNPPVGPIQTFDDGTTIQTFDDGSTLATGTDGKTSASNATDIVAVAPKGPAAGSAPADSGTNTEKPQTTNPASTPAPGRNKFFTNDYYMDDLEIESVITQGSPSNVSKITFKIVEPNGITLFFNLTNAIREFYKQDKIGIQDANFVMVIRFFGWDEKGNLITKIAPVPGSPGTTTNNQNAVVVKYFPFNISNITFKNAGKAIEYTVSAYAAGYSYSQSTALGSIPHAFNLVGETVGDLLNGTAVVSNTGDDSKRTTTESPAQAKSPQQLASIATGTDPNAANDQGMAFGVGGLSG